MRRANTPHLIEGTALLPDAGIPEPTLQPTEDQLSIAAAAAMLSPSVLIRTINYALKFLDRELAEHPEDQMMAQAETDDVYGSWSRSPQHCTGSTQTPTQPPSRWKLLTTGCSPATL